MRKVVRRSKGLQLIAKGHSQAHGRNGLARRLQTFSTSHTALAMQTPMFSPEQVATRTGHTKNDKAVRLWLATQTTPDRIAFLKQLWPLNYRYALILTRGAQLSRHENEALLQHWLTTGGHNAARELISQMEPVVGQRRFWKIVEEAPVSEDMRSFLNYYSGI